jgi:hypothetical protein
MKMFTSIRHDWWRNASSRFMVLTGETFSPVTMLKSVRIPLAIAAYFNYEI